MSYKFRRLSAFIFDMFLVTFLAGCLSNMVFTNPYLFNYQDLMSEYSNLSSELISANGSSVGEVYNRLVELILNIDKNSLFIFLWYIVFYIFYYVLFCYYNKGRTVGKVIFKLKVDNYSLNKLFIRSLFNGSSVYMGVNFIVIMRMILSQLISNAHMYIWIFVFLAFVSFVYEIVCFVMLFMGRDNKLIDDIVSKSSVIDA